MSAPLLPAARQIQADVAGLTNPHPAPPTAHGPQWPEVLNSIGTEYGGLHHLFGMNELDTVASKFVERPLDVATDSLRGRFGGLVPSRGSVVAPGPTVTPPSAYPTLGADTSPGVVQPSMPGQVAPAIANAPGGYPAETTLGARIRRFLGL